MALCIICMEFVVYTTSCGFMCEGLMCVWKLAEGKLEAEVEDQKKGGFMACNRKGSRWRPPRTCRAAELFVELSWHSLKNI